MFDMAAIPFHALNDLNFREMGEHVHRRKSIDLRDVRNLAFTRHVCAEYPGVTDIWLGKCGV